MKKKVLIYFGLVAVALVIASPEISRIMKKIDAGESGKVFTNSIGMKFVSIPAGSFYMGSCKLTEADKKGQLMGMAPQGCPSGGAIDGDARDNETPQHKVRIGAFRMGMHEVTLGQFKQFIAGANRGDLLSVIS